MGGTYFYKDEYGNYIANSESLVSSIEDVDFITNYFSGDIYYSLTAFTNTYSLIIDRSYATNIRTNRGQYGTYKIVTGLQTDRDCGCQAALNMIYTYDFTYNSNVAHSRNWNIEIDNMHIAMNWIETGRSICGRYFYGVTF